MTASLSTVPAATYWICLVPDKAEPTDTGANDPNVVFTMAVFSAADAVAGTKPTPFAEVLATELLPRATPSATVTEVWVPSAAPPPLLAFDK
ncbi:hypothetical protein [Variovorax sp. Varisp36]|uniref:hypothetical protein n=1 Tax=Variovorax sp. Varisp36 TaxID=3243031 RepID=UPI0039A75CF7